MRLTAYVVTGGFADIYDTNLDIGSGIFYYDDHSFTTRTTHTGSLQYHQVQFDNGHQWGEFFGTGGSGITVNLYERYGVFLNHPTLSQDLTPGAHQSHAVSSPRYHLRSPGFYGPFDMLFGDHNSERRGGIFYDEDASMPYISIYASSSTDYSIIYSEKPIDEIGS